MDAIETSADASMDVAMDVAYDIPDLGTAETDSGIPCDCVGAIPNGWTPVAYDPSGRPACPMSYGVAANVIEANAPQATCSCGCGNGFSAAPACDGIVNFALAFGNTNACNNGPTLPLNAIKTSCTTINNSLAPGGNQLNYMAATGAAPSPGGGVCNGPSPNSKSIPPPHVDFGPLLRCHHARKLRREQRVHAVDHRRKRSPVHSSARRADVSRQLSDFARGRNGNQRHARLRSGTVHVHRESGNVHEARALHLSKHRLHERARDETSRGRHVSIRGSRQHGQFFGRFFRHDEQRRIVRGKHISADRRHFAG